MFLCVRVLRCCFLAESDASVAPRPEVPTTQQTPATEATPSQTAKTPNPSTSLNKGKSRRTERDESSLDEEEDGDDLMDIEEGANVSGRPRLHVNEYEEERARTIARNKILMAGLDQELAALLGKRKVSEAPNAVGQGIPRTPASS